MERARLVSLSGSILTPPSSTLAETSPCSTTLSSPFGPFSLTVCPATLAVTPEGMGTGFFPTRDMTSFSFGCSLEHRAEDFAADIGVARIMIGHDALGRRDDGDAEAVVDARQRLDRGIDPPPRFRHARDFADNRRAVEILELDVELAAPI